MPANPSLSINLNDLYAETSVRFAHGNVSGKPAFTLLVAGLRKPSFEIKIQQFLQRIWDQFSIVREQHLYIQTLNNFPHGTGIASSAAGFGALALCICELEEKYSGIRFKDLRKEASRIARLGSGSACRSIYAGVVMWGKHAEIAESSDEFAISLQLETADPLHAIMDAVLIVDDGEKKVSSSEGHALLTSNPYAETRFDVAAKNLSKLILAMGRGNVRSFISLVESEALQLHAMMMASNPYFILMRPNTIAIIEKIWEYREKTGTPLMFTLDAGANVHILFPKMYTTEIVGFIDSELIGFCKNRKYLCTATGNGPEKI